MHTPSHRERSWLKSLYGVMSYDASYVMFKCMSESRGSDAESIPVPSTAA